MSQNYCKLITILLIVCQMFSVYSLSIDKKTNRGSGKYVENNNGKYVADHNKWAYKHDNRGKYVHVHIPYNGGYGPFKNPYEHDGKPYEHDGRPYEHDDKKYNDIFNVQEFTDKTPSIYREYGAPLFNSKF